MPREESFGPHSSVLGGPTTPCCTRRAPVPSGGKPSDLSSPYSVRPASSNCCGLMPAASLTPLLCDRTPSVFLYLLFLCHQVFSFSPQTNDTAKRIRGKGQPLSHNTFSMPWLCEWLTVCSAFTGACNASDALKRAFKFTGSTITVIMSNQQRVSSRVFSSLNVLTVEFPTNKYQHLIVYANFRF